MSEVQLEGSEGQLEGYEAQLEGTEGHLEGSKVKPRGDGRMEGRKISPFYRTSSPTGAAAQKTGEQGKGTADI